MGAIAASAPPVRGPMIPPTQNPSHWRGSNSRPELKSPCQVRGSRAAIYSSSSWYTSLGDVSRCKNFGTGTDGGTSSSRRSSSGLIPCVRSGGFWTNRCEALGNARHLETTTSVQEEIGMASGSDEWESRRTASTDLLVVGPGVLGSLVAQLWLKGNEGSLVVGQTNTAVHHENLKSLGVVPILKESKSQAKFPNVIFCAPPSGSSDYPAEVRAAAQKWSGEGTLLFTSSSGVYDVDDGGECYEEAARGVSNGQSPRTDRLLNAEAEVLEVGGNVVRLAGLYSFDRGAHMFYLSKGIVESRPDHVLNLIHYEDAASLCMAILRGGSRGKIYMGCDNAPISRQEMMDAVNASGKFEQNFKEFSGVDGPLGKKMNNNVTREITHWTPKYESFSSFLGVTGNTSLKH